MLIPPLPDVHVMPWLRRVGQRLLPGWLAITIGGRTYSWRALSTPELAHEACHVAQWQRYGALFVPRYVRASWRAWRAGGRPYFDNAFEIAARAAADEVR